MTAILFHFVCFVSHFGSGFYILLICVVWKLCTHMHFNPVHVSESDDLIISIATYVFGLRT